MKACCPHSQQAQRSSWKSVITKARLTKPSASTIVCESLGFKVGTVAKDVLCECLYKNSEIFLFSNPAMTRTATEIFKKKKDIEQNLIFSYDFYL